jgi:hypothetical protein
MSATPNHNHDRSGRFTANNRYKFRPGDAPPGSDASRDKYRTALFKYQEERQRCDGLEGAGGRDGCHEQLRAAWHTQTAAELKLSELQQANPASRSQDLAYGFVNNEAPVQNPAVVIAQSAVAQAQRDVARLTEIEAALDSEIQHSQSRLGFLRSNLRDCLNELICSDLAFQSLLDELDRTHAHLRGLHKCFRLISKEIGGLPHKHFTHINQRISLDPDVVEPIEEGPARLWELALVKLRDDADAELPVIGETTEPGETQ